MPRIFILLIALVSICWVGPVAQTAPEASSVPFTLIAEGTYSGWLHAENRVITVATEWEAVWNQTWTG